MAKKEKTWDNMGNHATGSPPPSSDWTNPVEQQTPVSDQIVADAGALGGKVHEIQTNASADGNVVYVSEVHGVQANMELLGKLKTTSVTGEQFSLVGRLEDVSGEKRWYKAAVVGGDTLLLSSVAGASESIIAQVAFTWLANTWYWMRFKLTGTLLQVKLWEDGGAEPTSWNIVENYELAEGEVTPAQIHSDAGLTGALQYVDVDAAHDVVFATWSNKGFLLDAVDGSQLASSTAADRPDWLGENGGFDSAGNFWAEPDNLPSDSIAKYTSSLTVAERQSASPAFESPGYSIYDVGDGRMVYVPCLYGATWFDAAAGFGNRNLVEYCDQSWSNGFTVANFPEKFYEPGPATCGCVDKDGDVWLFVVGWVCGNVACDFSAVHVAKPYLVHCKKSTESFDYYSLAGNFVGEDQDGEDGGDYLLESKMLGYDPVLHCLLCVCTAPTEPGQPQNIVKFNIATKTVTGVCEEVVLDSDSPYRVIFAAANSKWWFPNTLYLEGSYRNCFQKLDIATMTIEKTVYVDAYDGQDGLGVGACDAPTRYEDGMQFHSGLGCMYCQLDSLTDPDCDGKMLHKIELDVSNSAFIRYRGKAGWGASGKDSTVSLDWESVGTRTEPPGPGDVGDEDDGHEERPFDSFKIVGPGSIGRAHKFGRGVKP